MATTALFVPGSAGETFGTVLQTRRAGDFLFRESRYPRGLATPAHYHPRAYLCYVAEGGITERDTRGEVSYRPGTLHFHPAGHAHAVTNPDRGFTSVSIIPLGAEAGPLESMMSPRGRRRPARR
jgi:quercetin dioxygenase-like cupin family protein